MSLKVWEHFPGYIDGKWKSVYVKVEEYSSGEKKAVKATDFMEIEFKADNTYISKISEKSFSGTWKKEGDKVIISSPGTDEKLEGIHENGLLTFNYSEGTVSTVIYFSKDADSFKDYPENIED